MIDGEALYDYNMYYYDIIIPYHTYMTLYMDMYVLRVHIYIYIYIYVCIHIHDVVMVY